MQPEQKSEREEQSRAAAAAAQTMATAAATAVVVVENEKQTAMPSTGQKQRLSLTHTLAHKHTLAHTHCESKRARKRVSQRRQSERHNGQCRSVSAFRFVHKSSLRRHHVKLELFPYINRMDEKKKKNKTKPKRNKIYKLYTNTYVHIKLICILLYLALVRIVMPSWKFIIGLA